MDFRKLAPFILFFFCFLMKSLGEQHTPEKFKILVFNQDADPIALGKAILFLEDKTNSLTYKEVLTSNEFKASTENTLSLGITNSTFWLKFSIQNLSPESDFLIDLAYATIDEAELFIPEPNGKYKLISLGEFKKFKERPINDPDYLFPVQIPYQRTQTFILKLRCKEQFMVPLFFGTYKSVIDSKKSRDYFSGMYAGIILVMMLYNLFIYFTVHDKSYLYYVLYISTIGLTMTCLQGYTFQYLYPDKPYLAQVALLIPTFCSGIAGIAFVKNFLLVKHYSNKGILFLNIIMYIYIIAVITALFGYYSEAIKIINLNAGAISLVLIYLGFAILKKGYTPAKYFLIAQLIFLVGVVIYILASQGILPYNNFTRYMMQLGSVIDVILLSLALADRINILKEENDIKQEQIIKHLKENEAYLKISQELAMNTERLKKEILSSNYESLKNQVNPHFLFNSLNVLTELVHRNQNDAVNFVKELAKIYRYVLENKDKEVVEVETEIQFIESFTYLLKIRYTTNLIVNIKYNEEKSFLIIPLTLQLLVENCIKHNIVSSEKPLIIDIYSEESYLVVSNNLQLKKSLDSSKIGLTNIQNRYAYLSNEEVIIINDHKNFTVKVPLLRMDENN